MSCVLLPASLMLFSDVHCYYSQLVVMCLSLWVLWSWMPLDVSCVCSCICSSQAQAKELGGEWLLWQWWWYLSGQDRIRWGHVLSPLVSAHINTNTCSYLNCGVLFFCSVTCGQTWGINRADLWMHVVFPQAANWTDRSEHIIHSLVLNLLPAFCLLWYGKRGW